MMDDPCTKHKTQEAFSEILVSLLSLSPEDNHCYLFPLYSSKVILCNQMHTHKHTHAMTAC